jgi:hypothetical protein
MTLAVSPALADYPVWDAEEIAHLAQKSAKMAEALSVAVELLNNVNDLGRTVGRFGTLSTLDFAQFNAVAGLNGVGMNTTKITSLSDASALVGKLTTSPSGNNQTTEVGQIRQTMDSLYRKAQENGYALAEHTRESLSVAPQRAELLVGQASSPTDLRGDIGANTAAALAILEQMVSLKAMLALILEIEATGKLRQSAPTTPGNP